MTWVAVGVTAVGAVGSVVAGGQASRGQQKAADQATALQQSQYNQTRQDNMPALEARNNALQQMQDLAGKYGSGVPTAQAVMGQPGYQFGLQQGNANIQNSAAAAGGLYSGAVGKALAKYGNDYATSKYGEAFNQMQSAQTNDFNRYASISGQGQTGANQLATSGANYANQAGNIGMSNANAQGAAGIGQWNALSNGLNQGVSAWNNRSTTQPVGGGASWFGGNSSSGAQMQPGMDYNYGGQASGWADGGPVRADEPKVGTRSPVRESGGGPLSANAIAALLASDKPVVQGGTRVNTLNPRAVLAERLKKEGEYAHGGRVSGPGGPKDDMIPARLSDGEHVMDAASVTALGHGDNEAGQQKLNKLRAMLKGKKNA